MKKLLLLLPALCLSSQVLAKVSYEDAIESNRPYHDTNGAVHIPPDTKGLSEAEQPDGSESGDTGHWVKVSSTTTDVVNAGAYSALLSPDSAGQACYKGTKGLILATARECNHWNSGGWHCEGYGPETITDYGYKAECK
ncbi:hypothetical protein C1S99_25940 [Vibrio parahaemolyticus]|uniref:hypothetical protein n=1 Tax=Vibrio parahaemolyticus TaxID=670 RepID=UPI00030DAEE1|nr:hypothetical protein [Vibrio parahaemolyticus]ALM69491.1 hypothetical protein FORC4_p059 [Vibrio parahaemolyticus]EHK7406665.1 hypothetical protein [Vibrio parahaemolyticus]PMS39071.1 hypothetical protein C1T12_26325 [Vibrio parahaemolyticus]PMS57538.1 hypothetical protein C1S91_26115 [Vibrio parahaemolyticus]PMS65272.1 hypothetical protein C1S96_25870 [Vibrio parahaemolyticus]